MNLFLRFWNKNKEEITHVPELLQDSADEVTDEIELSLWHLKEELDLPTEEIEVSVSNRRQIRLNRKKS